MANIIFAGTPEFSVPSLMALTEIGFNPSLVITQPDRRAGRGKKIKKSPVKIAAEKLQIPISQPVSINDSEYLGDLLVTCYSSFSRNRTLGNMIGKGYSLRSAISEMSMIAEGYYATKNAFELISDKKEDFKIIHSAYKILYEKKTPKTIIKELSINLD